jgi:carbon-monoxide dehydrogenase medium subunit
LKLPPLAYASPRTVEEAITLLAHHDGEAKIISGGQSLMPMLAFRLAAPDLLVDLRHIPEIDSIIIDEHGVELGGKTTWRSLERDRRLSRAHPLLVSAIPHIAHYQIRNRGTVGGSLAHADPAAELPALAVTCDAEIIVLGTGGRRSIPASVFFVAPMVTVLEPSDVIVAIRFPPWSDRRHYAFDEFARRKGDFALAGVALYFDVDERGLITDPHVGAFGVGDVPFRIAAAEAVLAGMLPTAEVYERAVRACTDSVDPQSDLHAEADYRRALLATLLGRCLTRAGIER